MQFHDAYRILSTQNVSYAAAGGAFCAINGVCEPNPLYPGLLVGVVSATIDGVRIAIDASPTATATSDLLAMNFPEIFKVSPGQKIAVLGNNTGTGNVSA